MKPTLQSQIQLAQDAYDKSFSRHPKAAFTIRMRDRLRDLTTKKLKVESKAA